MSQIPLIDLKAQYRSIKSEIDTAIQTVLDDCMFVRGPHVAAFEREFADYCRLPHAVGVSSGTTALHLVFAALRLGPGDEVITVPNTFMATTETILQTGARPVFVDVDEETMNMNPEWLEAAITERTRAIVPVHLYGQIADMTSIMDIARAHRLPVVEDAAQAHGAEHDGIRAGHFGVAATFSFYPGKILGAYGDAGIVVTQDDDMDARLRLLCDHGTTDKENQLLPGFNYRLDGIQAAVLSVKLRHLDGWIERRRELAEHYRKLFAGANIVPPVERLGGRHVYTYYVIRVENRAGVRHALEQENISTQVHYPVPIHLQTAYENLGYQPGDFPAAERAAERILSLPLYPEMGNEQVEHVARAVLTAVE